MSEKQKPWEHHEAEEGGEEGWLVSYADMVTLLFGFFVILYSMANLDEKKFEQMGENVASAFKAPETEVRKDKNTPDALSKEARQARALQMMGSMVFPTESAEQLVRKIEAAAKMTAEAKEVREQLKAKSKQFGDDLLSEKPESSFVELTLPEKILFSPGSDSLAPDALAKLASLGKSIAEIKGIERVEVVGHTDSSPPGKNSVFRTNFALSSARAGSVASALISGGMNKDLISVKGMGDLEPIAKVESGATNQIAAKRPELLKEKNNDIQAKNRRVQLIIRKISHD
jgi:chemotaxis protein MotB